MDAISNALFDSLAVGPLLMRGLPEAPVFPYHALLLPKEGTVLNLDQKLGHLYEDALGCLLEASPQYDVLCRNLQLEDANGRTVGELDYLLEDIAAGELIHLELAVKFYLAVESDHGLELPGPDPRDNYFNKLAKMRDHQLTLAQQYGDLFPSVCEGRRVVTRQLVYGCLFDHVHAAKPAAPEFLHPEARRGKWLHVSECEVFFGSGTRLEFIPKALWPVSLDRLDEMELEEWSPDPAIDCCIMVRVPGEGTPYFIAPDGYPIR